MTLVFRNPVVFLLMMLVVIALAWGMFGGQVVFRPHAVERHQEQAVTARDCAYNPLLTMQRKADGHFADICQTSDGLFGVFVYNMVNGVKEEVTAFQKNKMRSLDQVIKYLQNVGYE